MRKAVTLFMLISTCAFGQRIKYNLILKSPCNENVENGFLYYLEKSGKQYHIADSLGTIFLEESGEYRLISSIHGIDKIVEINDPVSLDTLVTKRLEECLEAVSHPNFIGYCCCEEKCEGFQRDFYDNGALRIEGNFKNGMPTGKVKLYYRNGSIKEIRHHNKKGILRRITKYSQEGNKI